MSPRTSQSPRPGATGAASGRAGAPLAGGGTEAGAGAGGLSRDIWVLAVVDFCVALGFGVVSPVLPMFAKSFGVGPFAASAVISVFALMRLASDLFVGRVDDRIGVKATYTLGLLVVAVSSLLAGLSPNYAALLALRGVGGIGSAMFSVAGMTLVLAVARPAQRARAAAVYQGGFLIGAVAGPAVGGVFAQISMRAPFFFYAGTLAVSAAVSAFLLRAAPTTTSSDPTRRPARMRPGSLGRVARDRRFQAACLTNLTSGWATNLRSALVPLLVAATMYHEPKRAALMTAVAMAIAAGVQAVVILPGGSMADRWGRRRPMIAGSLICAAAIMALPTARTIAVLTAGLCVFAVGSAVMSSAPAAVVGDAAGPGQDRAVAVFVMSSDVGAIIGPLVGGALVPHVGYVVAFAPAALLWVVSLVMSIRMPRDTRPTGSPPAL